MYSSVGVQASLLQILYIDVHIVNLDVDINCSTLEIPTNIVFVNPYASYYLTVLFLYCSVNCWLSAVYRCCIKVPFFSCLHWSCVIIDSSYCEFGNVHCQLWGYLNENVVLISHYRLPELAWLRTGDKAFVYLMATVFGLLDFITKLLLRHWS